MKSSIKDRTVEAEKLKVLFTDNKIDEFLSRFKDQVDLEATAKETRALLRKREIKTAFDLLRLSLAYAACDWSLRLVGSWCTLMGIGSLSDVAVLNRLRHCRLWLGKLVALVLQTHRLAITSKPGLRLRLMDGTSMSQPGSAGTDWRLHLSFDLEAACIDGVELTNAQTGETFAHVPIRAGEIRIGDRGYAFVKSLESVLESQGAFIVRINWHNLPLNDEQAAKLDLLHLLRQKNTAEPITEYPVWLRKSTLRVPLRLLVTQLPQEVGDKARAALRRKHQKKGTALSKESLFAAGFIMVLSNLSMTDWPPKEIFKLYRFRWQIELAIKRLKSLLKLESLRAQDAELVQVYLLAKLLAALLVDNLVQKIQRACPLWFQNTHSPISLWRLTALLFEVLLIQIRGVITLERLLATLPKLRRFLCDSPRKRIQQLAQARSLLTKITWPALVLS